MPDEPTDKEIDAAQERMAHLLGPEFVASCETETVPPPKRKLEAELAEARAQIAAIEVTDRHLIEENGRLQAQIAAKDAALRWIVDATYHYITTARMRDVAERALAAPAREPE